MKHLSDLRGVFLCYNKEKVGYLMKDRKILLKLLKHNIERYEEDLFTAFKKDLGKSKFEVYTTEIGIIKQSISHTIKNMDKWLKDEKVKTPLYLFGNKSKIVRSPLGKVLIISSFNYPFQLLFEPLIGALASGNIVVCKPSEFVPNINSVIDKILKATLDEGVVRFVQGDKEVTQNLLKEKFDLIFFTGSEKVGRIIYEKAAETLTPVVLELGGKSPAIVYDDASLELAVSRIVWGKFLNGGQTCVAPDYVLVDKNIEKVFIEKCIASIEKMFSLEITSIVSQSHIKRLEKLIEASDVIYGGVVRGFKVMPTLIRANMSDKIMKEEIFGPILPIVTFENNPKPYITKNPLSLYVFTEDKKKANTLMKEVSFGGGMINNTILHLSNPNLPFGGIGTSGMGSDHARYSMDTFTHKKAIMTSSTFLNHKLLEPPYSKLQMKLMRRILK